MMRGPMIEMLILTGVLSGLSSMAEAREVERRQIYEALLDAHQRVQTRIANLEWRREHQLETLEGLRWVLEHGADNDALVSKMIYNLDLEVESLAVQISLEHLDLRRVEANIARVRSGKLPKWGAEIESDRLDLRQQLRHLKQRLSTLYRRTETTIQRYGPGSHQHLVLLDRAINLQTAFLQTAQKLYRLEGLPRRNQSLLPPVEFAGSSAVWWS